MMVGGQYPALNRSQVENLKIPLPPLPEQAKIAEILSTVDQAIEKVDEAIGKTLRVKKGLMQELLTKGIGHKEFKETEIGRVPKEWEVTQLKDAVEINRNSVDPAREFPNDKFLYIDIDSVENGTGVITKAKEILGKNAPSRARRVIHYNDVLMSTVRPYLKAFAIVPKTFHRQLCSTGFAVLTCGEIIDSPFLLYALFTGPVIDQCNRMMVGGQYPALNSSQVEKIKIPLPPIQEQQKISEILSAMDERMELLRRRKERLEKIKKGLMNNLLTGKWRVNI
jgi:type I restriction enzyme S subunit